MIPQIGAISWTDNDEEGTFTQFIFGAAGDVRIHLGGAGVVTVGAVARNSAAANLFGGRLGVGLRFD
jgi:hypothetical protein